MHLRAVFASLAVLTALPASAQTVQGSNSGSSVEPYRAAAERIIAAALADSSAYERLAYVADTFGHRLSGSQPLEDAIDWILQEMRADGLEGVRGQPVMVPVWVRGEESATLVRPREQGLAMLGLGGSVGTPPEGVTAEVLVVGSFEELEEKAGEAAGRIVLFNVPFTTYGETVAYRVGGAVAATRAGAVAALVRSVGPYGIQTPHTGSMRYEAEDPARGEGVQQIPAAALAIEGAELLQRLQDRGVRPVVTLRMGAHARPDALSRNVLGEIRGRERPEEVVVLGGHVDSWDVGQGAMDDMGGCVAAWEAVRLLHALGLRPRRTVRAVLWTNEENGLRGATTYRDSLGADVANHVLAVESDGGVFAPLGFGLTANDTAFAMVEAVEGLLGGVLEAEPEDRVGVTRGGGGADIGPLMQAGVPGAHLNTAADRYFWYHHTAGDTVDKLDPRDLARSAAAMAVLAYVVAEMPERLPLGPPANDEE